MWLLAFDGVEAVKVLLLRTAERFGSEGAVADTLAFYALICIISQLIVVPSGSLILLVAGFLYGPFIAAGVFSVAQLLTAWPVYRVADSLLESRSNQTLEKFKHLVSSSRIAKSLRTEGFLASVTIRLTPVIPSAAACVLAAGLAIPQRSFLAATAAVCWVRPLFFASIGGSIKEVGRLRESMFQLADINLVPIMIVFASAAILLIARLWLRYYRG